MAIINIRKRDGRMVEFDQAKIENAILRAFQASSSAKGRETAQSLAERVVAEWSGLRWLLLTCYDLRFPVWSRCSRAGRSS